MPLLNIDWTNNSNHPLSLLSEWSSRIADALNAKLPAGRGTLAWLDGHRRQESAETAARLDSPSGNAATLIAPARFTDRFGVTVVEPLETRLAAAAVLLVTPDNKADSDASLAFAVRAAGLMMTGAGVVIVDIMPGPPAWATHLHSLTGVYPLARRPRNGEASILAVQPEVRDGAERFAVWLHTVAVGSPLPTVPLPVRGALHLKLDLEATYAEACAAGGIS